MAGYQNQQSLYDHIANYVGGWIDNGAQQNQQRHAFHQWMSERGYNNQQFNQLVETVVAVVDLASADRGRQLADVEIQQRVEEYCFGALCSFITSDAQLQQGMDNNQLSQTFQSAQYFNTRLNQLYQAINGGYQQRQQPQQYSNYSQPHQNQPYRGVAPAQGTQHYKYQGEVYTPPPRGGAGVGLGRAATGASDAPVTDARAVLAARSNAEQATAAQVTTATVSAAAAPVAQTAGQLVVPSLVTKDRRLVVPTTEGPDYCSVAPFNVFRHGKDVWTPAHHGHFALKDKYGTLVDPNVGILFYVRSDDGTVREEIMPINQELEYLRNEIATRASGMREGLVEPVRTMSERVNRTGVVGRHPAAIAIEELKQQSTKLRSMIMEVPAALCVGSLADAFAHIQTEHLIKATDLVVRVYYTETPIVHAPSAGIDFRSINRAPAALASELRNLYPKVNRALWNTVNDRLTSGTNQLLREWLGMPRSGVDSFVGDIEEMFRNMVKNRGEQALAKFVHDLREVINGALLIQDHLERKAAWFQDTCDIEYNPTAAEVTLFCDSYVVAYAPGAASGIFPGILEQYTRLDPAKHAEQIEFCRMVMDVHNQHGGTHPAILLTGEGERIHITRWDGSDNISVRLV